MLHRVHVFKSDFPKLIDNYLEIKQKSITFATPQNTPGAMLNT